MAPNMKTAVIRKTVKCFIEQFGILPTLPLWHVSQVVGIILDLRADKGQRSQLGQSCQQ